MTRLTGITHDVRDGRLVATARLDDETLWFDVPDRTGFAHRADPFVVAALLPAMTRGGTLEIDSPLPVSPRLLAGIAQLQEVYLRWYRWARPVHLAPQHVAPADPGRDVAALFSGGVDSAYTVLRRHAHLSHLLVVDRIDLGKAPTDELFAEVVARHADVATALGLQLVTAHTNVKDFGHAFGLDWSDYLGPALSAVAMTAGFGTLYIGSSATWADLAPAGSHPVTDPLWSTESLEIIHDGCGARRIDKLQAIVHGPAALGALRVCLQGKGGNCGRCEKCLRTMAGARAIGATVTTLPPLADVSVLRGVKVRSPAILEDWIELLDVVTRERDADLHEAIAALVRTTRIRWHLRELDQLLTGGRMRRLLRRP